MPTRYSEIKTNLAPPGRWSVLTICHTRSTVGPHHVEIQWESADALQVRPGQGKDEEFWLFTGSFGSFVTVLVNETMGANCHPARTHQTLAPVSHNHFRPHQHTLSSSSPRPHCLSPPMPPRRSQGRSASAPRTALSAVDNTVPSSSRDTAARGRSKTPANRRVTTSTNKGKGPARRAPSSATAAVRFLGPSGMGILSFVCCLVFSCLSRENAHRVKNPLGGKIFSR